MSNKAPRRPAALGHRTPEMTLPKSIDKRVPLLLEIAIRRFSDKGMHMFLRPYDTPVPRLSRLEETASSSMDKRCSSFILQKAVSRKGAKNAKKKQAVI
jgi:hypothetical protein